MAKASARPPRSRPFQRRSQPAGPGVGPGWVGSAELMLSRVIWAKGTDAYSGLEYSEVRVPGEVELPAGGAVTLTFRKTGFVSQKREIRPSEERALTVALSKAAPKARPGPDDPEDPFR